MSDKPTNYLLDYGETPVSGHFISVRLFENETRTLRSLYVSILKKIQFNPLGNLYKMFEIKGTILKKNTPNTKTEKNKKKLFVSDNRLCVSINHDDTISFNLCSTKNKI